MSIIQKIREKGALISAIIIALALLGFIAMDAFTGRSQIFGGGPSTTVGKVNGKRIDYDEFQYNMSQQERYMVSQGYPSGEATRQQALEQAWSDEVGKILITDELNKLGMKVSEKELSNSVLFGSNPPQFLQQFKDAQGNFDANLASQQLNATLKGGSPEQKSELSNYINQLRFMRLRDKYTSLLINSINYPKWMLEKQNADLGLLAKIAVVRKAYSEIPDSSVTVSDSEIKEFMGKHKDDFKQEETRSISYVTFSAAPSAADSNEVRARMEQLKQQLLTTPDVQTFLASEGAQNGYYDSYISGKAIQIPQKDSIFKIPVGTVYGPYLDGNNFSIAKLIAVRQIPDTVKVRHILIATQTQDPQTRQWTAIRDTTTARAIADSVMRVIAAGQSFDSLVLKISDDGGSKDKGGVYDIPSGQMVPPFNEFSFTKPAGSKGIVKTDFGYHYMEVMSTKGSSTGYRIAYLSKPITVSSATDQDARNAASDFAGRSRDQKSFDANFDKELKPKGRTKNVAIDIRPSGAEVTGLEPSRSFVRKIYDAKLGEVLAPERVGSDYVVALVTEINKEGQQTVAKARGSVEPLLRNKKKAEIIKKQLGPITTLEAVAAKLSKPIESVDSLRMLGNRSQIVSFEPKVIGASFNTANRGKVVPEAIEGSQGVYVIRVDNVSATALTEGNIEQQRNGLYNQGKQNFQNMVMRGYDPVLGALKEAATIKDNRSKHF